MLKRLIYKALSIILLSLIFSFCCLLNVYSQSNKDQYKLIRTFKKDTTGDKINDTVKILADVDGEGYIVEVHQHNGKTYALKPAGEFKYLAPYTPFWNINIQIADINNDTIPEIITWGDMTHENAIHIFRWSGKEYKIVYSGFNTGFDFKDITGDKILELVIDDRLYGTGDEFTYYQWQKNQYKSIYYEVTANRGFEKIKGLVDFFRSLHDDDLSYSNNYFKSLVKDYFTEDWLSNENNISYLREFGKDLYSIQITKYINDKLEFDSLIDKPAKDTWRLKVLAFKIKNTRIVPKEMILTAVTKYIGNNEYKIDSIEFSDFNYNKDNFYQSVKYNPDKGLLSFTIPLSVPEGYKFYLHISGRMSMGNKNNCMSFHAFDKESENYSWEKGKTYTLSLKSENLVECLVSYGLVNKAGKELLYTISVSADGTKSRK